MRSSLFVAAFFASAAFVSLQGCAASASDEATTDETAASQDELTTSANRLVGAFHLANASVRPPTFDGIAFNGNGEFFADVDTGIRCMTAPCPSNVRITGKFTATRSTLTLSPKGHERTTAFHGKYNYKLDGDKLTLTQDGVANWKNTLDNKAGSYCVEATDCQNQMLIVPACVGHFTCSEERTCHFACGITPVASIWPADRTQLVAENKGGGFAPPPPPGSTCFIGANKFVLDIPSRELAWEKCELVGSALQMVKGKRALSASEMKKVDAAMNEVTVSTQEICGADKPFLAIKVTSASQGEKTYADSFYSCRGGDSVYVDSIDSPFIALSALAH